MKKAATVYLGSLIFEVNGVKFVRTGTYKDENGLWFHDIMNLSNGKRAYNVPESKIKNYIKL